MTKYRKLQHELDEAEERADMAEAALAKMRTRTNFWISKNHNSSIKQFIIAPVCELFDMRLHDIEHRAQEANIG